jgi:nucleoporin NUP159
MPNEVSMGSTATLGSTGSSFSFGKPSGTDSLFSKPALSKEETMEEDSSAAKPSEPASSNTGSFGMPSGGFKLGTTFKGDGTAKDDLVNKDIIKPVTPTESLFGSGFGSALNAAASTKPEPAKAPSPSFGFIKKEPGTEEEKSLKDIPEAPKPQTTASKPDAKIPEDAPLPPDPSTYKAAKIPEDLPLPPDPSTYKAKPIPDDLPLPPDPSSQKTPQGLSLPPPLKQEDKPKPTFSFTDSNKSATSDAPIVGSPPVDIGKDSLVQEASKKDLPEDENWDDDEDDEDGDEDENDDEDDEEGDDDEEGEEDDDDEEEDEDEEEGEEEDTQPFKVSDPAGLASFMRRVTPASPKASSSQNDSTTPQSTLKVSYTPAGMPKTIPKGPTFLPPAARPQISPRSPSPQRAVTNPVGSKDFSMNPMHSQMKASAVPPARPIERKEVVVPKPKEPTAGELQDEEDDRIREILASPVEPITTLQSFLTHQEFTGSVKTTGIPAQIEKVFRDINAMVDVAGLNARHIGAFVQGHKQLSHPGDRTIDDLEDADAWVLEDLKDMPKILKEMETQLSEGQLQNPEAIISEAKAHENDLIRLRNRTSEMRKAIAVHTDSEHLAAQEAAPLDAETQAQQAELRQRVQTVQKLLAEVEEKMSFLRADLSSASSRLSADKFSSSSQNAAPTVEAVINTILKMTAMVEQRSGDVDVLEAQIRRLPQGLAALRLSDSTTGDYEDSLVAKMRTSRFTGSPSATPPRRTVRMAANGDPLGMSGMFGLSSSRFRTPPSASVLRSAGGAGLGGSAMFSPGAGESPARKKMGDVTNEEVVEWRKRKERRDAVLKSLKERVLGRETRVVRLG